MVEEDKIIYPIFKKDDTIENIHGHHINDPYRWLEDPSSEDTKQFVKRQNEITQPFIEKSKHRERIIDKLTLVWNYPNYGCISQHGDWFYYFYNTGLQNQSVLYRMRDINGEGEKFMDPNSWSDDGTISLTITSYSEDGKLMAFGQSSSGHDWIVVKFLNTDTMEILDDQLVKIKFSSVHWTHDNSGVFYSGYLEQDGSTDGTETTSNINQKVRYHKIGTPQSSDILCYEMLEEPKWLFSCEVSDCGQYVLLYIHESCDPNVMVSICNLNNINYLINDKLPFHKLIDNFHAKYDYISNDGPRFLFNTNKDAPMHRVVELDISDLNNLVWKDIIVTKENTLLNWAKRCDNDKLIICYQIDVTDSVSVHCIKTGVKLRDISFPLGTISSITGKWNLPMIFIKFASYLVPGINYSYDVSKGDKGNAELKVLQKAAVKGIDLNEFILKQDFYQTKDGVKIPIFIMHHKDMTIDGNNPCRLYGYGGFDVSIKPGFNPIVALLIKHYKFVCCVANIRGGGEYGEPWHNGGRLQNKQNCFDDFIAASEYLINQKYTNKDKLYIEGASNGGLLVAACMNQRPDLFGAIVAHVGVHDMLRFHKFTIGHAWVSDFGDPDKPDEFEWIIKYSPLHNINSETQYPACLLLTADHDDRVVPLHTMKFIAQLQETVGKTSRNPLLVRVDVKSGHGGGKPTKKRIEEASDIICFLQIVLKLDWYD